MDVVVIDDSKLIRSLMAGLLRDLGCYSVRPYEGVNQACLGIENQRPSMVLCDWKMAAADGSVFLDRIRSHKDDAIARMPIIIVTGFGSRDILVEAMKKGATQFLVKPVVPRELIKKIAFAHNDDREMVRNKAGRMVYLQPKAKTKPQPAAPTAPSPKVAQTVAAVSRHRAPVSQDQTDSAVWKL